MTRVLAKPVRAEGAVISVLAAAFTARGYSVNTANPTLKIDTVIPTTTWTVSAVPFLQVALDGITQVQYPILWRASVRVTAWAFTTVAAQDLASVAEALLLSGAVGGARVFSIQSLTGVQVTKDAATSAQLATISVRANLKGVVFT